MANEYKTIICRIDGKQSVSIPIDITQAGRHITSPLDVIVRGFLKFEESTTEATGSNELVDKTVVYPVLFTSDTIRINDGRCVITIMPRSEDLFEETSVVVESASVSDDEIVSQGGISEDEQITDPDKHPIVIKIETGVIRTPYKLSIEITATSVDGTSFYAKTVDRGTSPEIDPLDAVTSLFQKVQERTPSNIIIDCYNDQEWIPTVDNILGNNNATREEMVDALGDLENSTPFGISPMYDGVVAAARVSSDGTVDDEKKTVYVFTDNEANISQASLDNAIDEVNDIDGDKRTAVLISNMAVTEPSTLSVRANSSDTKNINKLSFLTGGQALTVVDEQYLDDIAGIFYREAVGSMGYGTYEFIADLGEETLINQITGFFDIPTSDSNATWSIETSLDGYNYTVVNDSYSHSETPQFENLYARYIRFKIILITAINSVADEYGAYPETPALISIQILYNAYKIAYLYLNKVDVDIQPYQMTMAVDANEVNDEQIKVGVAKSDSHNWSDFSTASQPPVDQNGKIVIPLRFSKDIAEFQQEPLAKIDTFNLKTEYGSFDAFATVTIYDGDDNIIPTNYYKLQPRNGMVVFNYALPSDYTDGDYKIGILNSEKYKVGLEMTNKTNDTGLELYGVGHLYTTGKDLLPPLEKTSPEARSVEILGDVFDRFSIMEASYVYFDANFEPEDTTQRLIKWFINGSPINYLDNVVKWNDINNVADPLYANTSLTYPDDLAEGETVEEWAKKQTEAILSSGDKVHFEISVSDGSLQSGNVKSNIADISDSTPIVGQLSVMGEYNGELTSRISGDTKIIIYPSLDDIFYSDGGSNQSDIVWYVNDEVFKRGVYGDTVPETQSEWHEIRPGDSGQNNTFAHRIANIIYVEVTPRSGDQVGTTIRSQPVSIENGLPQVGNVSFAGGNVHTENNNLVLGWDFYDYEILLFSAVDDTTQHDETEVRWYRKREGENDWPDDPVYVYNNHDEDVRETYSDDVTPDYVGHITTSLTVSENVARTSIVDHNILSSGQQWYAEVIPHDSVEPGVSHKTTPITIIAG
jgi:hypothetical protein